MSFNVQFNAGPSRDALRRASDVLMDMTPIFEDVADHMVRATKQRFLAGEAPDGSKWAPKSPVTLERYRRLGYGSLTRPLIGPRRALSTQILQFVTGKSVTIGSNLIYSQVMQDGAAKGAFGRTSRGAPIPWGRIPARTWLGISKADEGAIIDIAEEHVEKALGGA